jgi:uncharacterized membrane protein YgaE (UPF0421/DUF939 family)
MTGVEILATQEVVTAYAWNWSAYFVTVVIATIVMGMIGLFYGNRGDFVDFLLGCMIGAIIGIFVGILPASQTTPSEYETRYKVTISDEVSMNDFLSKYEIVGQEGKIYTVVERNEE